MMFYFTWNVKNNVLKESVSLPSPWLKPTELILSLHICLRVKQAALFLVANVEEMLVFTEPCSKQSI